jgi:hypothetical protein
MLCLPDVQRRVFKQWRNSRQRLQSPYMDRSELLSRVLSARERLEAALAKVNWSSMNDTDLYGAWSVKDMLAHIGWWEKRAAYVIDAVTHDHIPEDALNGGSINDLNARIYQEYHQLPLADVRRFEQEAFTALLSLTETLSEDELLNPQRYTWTEGLPLASRIIWNTYEHYDEHLTELQGWVDRTSSD